MNGITAIADQLATIVRSLSTETLGRSAERMFFSAHLYDCKWGKADLRGSLNPDGGNAVFGGPPLRRC